MTTRIRVTDEFILKIAKIANDGEKLRLLWWYSFRPYKWNHFIRTMIKGYSFYYAYKESKHI